MSSTIVLNPPPPDPGEEGGRLAAKPKVRIVSVTLELEDGATAQESGHEVTRALNAVSHFNAG